MEKFRKNMGYILEINLALESYHDDTATEYRREEIGVYDDLQFLEEQNNNLSEAEKIKRSEDILTRLNTLLDEIGREKFIFYNDGGMEYTYINLHNKGDGNNG